VNVLLDSGNIAIYKDMTSVSVRPGQRMEGWGGVGRTENFSYLNNRRAGSQYDASGNVKFDGGFFFSYDVTGQQTSAWAGSHIIDQSYDGDGLECTPKVRQPVRVIPVDC
jgi:hypothetical protein